jgi:Methyltransferase domain
MSEATTDPVLVSPLISRPSSPPEGILASAVAKAFDIALGDVEQPAPAFLDLEGMSGCRYRLFANALVRLIPNPRYLEVGVWAGSTLCSAIAGNKVQAVAIDNWSQFGGPRESLLENLARFGATSQVTLIEHDFRAVRFADHGRFNVYLYDGPHSAADQHDGLALALPALDPEFVLIVDDWNWANVRTGTRSAIETLDLEVVFAIEVRTTADDTHPPHCGFEAKATDWHNGYFIAVLRKPAEPAPGGSLLRTTLASGWRRLTSGRESSKARTAMKQYASNPTICEILALITHHYVPERRRWLEEVLRGLADIGARRTHAIIVTNTADSASLTGLRNLVLPHTRADFSAEVVTAPALLHPHYLPWAQKPLIVERFLRKGSTFTHVVSMEDDIAFGRDGFHYWLQYRPLLVAHGLIPSFMRTEMGLGDPLIYATDANAANSMGSRLSVRVGAFTFIALDNPYCALFVLDRALATEYVASDSFHMGSSMSIAPWRARERAAMGLCWENPPPGFPVRHVVPVDEKTMSVAPCSHVRHLPGNYASNPASPFGKLPVGALLVP